MKVKMGLYYTLFKVLIALCCSISVSAVNYSRTDEGYSYGYLANCPGSTKPVVIKPKTLERLYISVLGPGTLTKAKWTPYNYYKIRNLAKSPEIDFKKKTFLYICGYLDSAALPVGRLLGTTYKKMGHNVLLLDTNEFTARDFPSAARVIRTVGIHAAEMLANLTTLGLDPKKLEVVGISLGGQTMSFMAKHYRQLTGKNISSLVGLDTAGPCFRHQSPDQRLDPSDADFVVNIATNINGFGISGQVGHVTFYVNGGEFQKGEDPELPCTVICSHIRAYFMWISALEHPHEFIGILCDSEQQARDGRCYERKPMVTNTLDMFTDRSKPGIYYLATSNNYPFALGAKGLKKEYREVIKPLKPSNVSDFLSIWDNWD